MTAVPWSQCIFLHLQKNKHSIKHNIRALDSRPAQVKSVLQVLGSLDCYFVEKFETKPENSLQTGS